MPVTKAKESKKSRWETTTSGQLAQTADPAVRAEVKQIQNEFKEQAETKKNNANNMYFGKDKVDYVTNAQAQMGRSVTSLDTKEMDETKKKIKEMKVLLGTATIELGDQAPTCYETTAKAASKESSQYAGKSGTQNELKSTGFSAKVSKIDFGHDKPDYVSEYTRACSTMSNDQDEFTKTKEGAKKLKETLSRRNFDLGAEEKLDYTSDARRHLVAHNPEEYRRNLMRKETKAYLEDTRKCHFSLGQDKIDYRSNTQVALTSGSASAGVRQEQLDSAKALKSKLTKTSYQIGNEDEDED